MKTSFTDVVQFRSHSLQKLNLNLPSDEFIHHHNFVPVILSIVLIEAKSFRAKRGGTTPKPCVDLESL